MSQIAVIALGSLLWFAVLASALSLVSAGLAQDLLLFIPVTLLTVLGVRIRAIRRLGRTKAASVAPSQSGHGQTVLG